VEVWCVSSATVWHVYIEGRTKFSGSKCLLPCLLNFSVFYKLNNSLVLTVSDDDGIVHFGVIDFRT
jgi:hypothetical protein